MELTPPWEACPAGSLRGSGARLAGRWLTVKKQLMKPWEQRLLRVPLPPETLSLWPRPLGAMWGEQHLTLGPDVQARAGSGSRVVLCAPQAWASCWCGSGWRNLVLKQQGHFNSMVSLAYSPDGAAS